MYQNRTKTEEQIIALKMLKLTAVLNSMWQVPVHGLCTCLVKTVGLPSTLSETKICHLHHWMSRSPSYRRPSGMNESSRGLVLSSRNIGQINL